MVITTPNEALSFALDSVLCACGNHKRINKPLCFACYDLLPRHAKVALSYCADPCLDIPLHMFTSDHARCFQAALTWLQQHGRLTDSALLIRTDNTPD